MGSEGDTTMRERRHALGGALYSVSDDGDLDVTARDGETSGVFAPNGSWKRCDLTHADPHLCSWLAGPQLPARLAVLPRFRNTDASQPERPPAAPIHWLDDDDDWTVATELGMLARVFNQDVYKLLQVQEGLEAMIKPGVTLADHQETKPRHFHAILDEWMAR